MDQKRDGVGNIRPRIIIHGGAGNIRRENLPRSSYEAYKASLLLILGESQRLLNAPDATALDIAVHAVSMLEDDPLFNCGKGAVFTRAGDNELEASVMVSNGYRKRGVGCMLLKHVRNPIKLAKEMLIKGEKDDGGGAAFHSQLSGPELERLAAEWGLELVDQDYFFTQRRWDEHIKGLEREKNSSTSAVLPLSRARRRTGVQRCDSHWNGHEYLPQGTVGAVVLDRFGTICAATSTGGLTNKLPGRIGDTPTLGAGFWAEEWNKQWREEQTYGTNTTPLDLLSRGNISGLVAACLPTLFQTSADLTSAIAGCMTTRHAVGLSGTGNGDSFLRTNAVRTTAAMARFGQTTSLADAVQAVAGPGGELEKSAGDRWGKTGEGEGGIIGIELVDNVASIAQDHNCGGMFRAWVDNSGNHRFMVFKEEY